MSRIQRLAPEVANQIAAGEVVERPAAVVKELVENAIDAGARRIVVTTELGGKRLLRVEDDGHGMDPDDARLSIERHATSKIERAADLEHVATLGFRGEALPSIASVCHFVLRTRARGAQSGTEIRVNGGTVAAVTETGMPEGTSVEAADLFFNLPARRKFLKSDAGESAQVSRIVTQLALCYPEIGFTLTSAGRTVIQVPPVASLHARLYQLYGERDDLIEVRRAGDVQVLGYVATLAQQGPTRGPQNVFVNRRIVKDRTIAHAIIEAYSAASIKERSPEVHLFIEMAREAVDVNVHPTKAEVRFRDQSHIHQVIRRTIADALGTGEAPPLTLTDPASGTAPASTFPLPHVYPSVTPSRWRTDRGGSWVREVRDVVGDGRQLATVLGDAMGLTRSGLGAATVGELSSGSVAAAGPPARPMTPLGQFRDTFIIAIDDEGIVIIDQHVAHERILFERITERLTSGALESQRVLEPVLVELPASAREALLAHAADVERLGFEVEAFGGGAVRVSAFPVLLGQGECDAAIRALAEDLDGLDHGAAVQDAIKRIAATMACHAAVKANDPLTPEKMRYLLEELRATAYSTICPHGRPVMLRLSRRELERRFERI